MSVVMRALSQKPTAFARLCGTVESIARRLVAIEARAKKLDDFDARLTRVETAQQHDARLSALESRVR